MTPAEKMAKRLDAQTACGVRSNDDNKCIPGMLCVRCEIKADSAALIRRLAAALVAAEMHIRGLSTIKGPEYASFTIHHADALRDVEEQA